MSNRAIKQALRDYCNWSTDLAELATVSRKVCAEDKMYCNDMKRQLHEYMQQQHIDCMLDTASQKFLFRSVRNVPRPLTEDIQSLILQEISKAEQEGKLVNTDTETLILDVITLIQKCRTGKSETLKIGDKKPTSVATVVTPQVPEVGKMLSNYIAIVEKNNQLDTSAKQVKKDLAEKIKEVEPIVKEYCSSHSIVKKPMNFPRRMSAEFSSCITKFEPSYFSTVKSKTARRYLQFKRSKCRNRKITTLRPSKKHMVATLEALTTQRKTGWSHTKLVRELFKTLYDEAEQAVIRKIQENETTPVFKVSLGASVED